MEMQHRFGEGCRVDILQWIAWARIDVQGDNPQEPLVVIPAVYEAEVVTPDKEREVIFGIEEV